METSASSGFFSFRRLGLLLRRDVANGYRSTLIAAASIAGVIILNSLLSMIGVRSGNGNVHDGMFTAILFIGGFVYTSMVFRELHGDGSAMHFLTLPSSPLEKFVSKVLVTSVGFAAALLVFSSVTALVSEGINQLVFGASHKLFNPVAPEILKRVAVYLVTQAVFLVGSIYFRKMAFVKTAGVVSLLITVVGIVCALVVCAVLRDQFSMVRPTPGMDFNFSFGPNMGRVIPGLTDGTATPRAIDVLCKVTEVLFWACLAPACWLIGFLKMREREV